MARPPPVLDTPQADRRVGNGLVLLGFLTQVALLPWAPVRWAGGLLPAFGAVVVLFARPLGNRVLAVGLAALSALLVVALWRFEVFFRMLVVLVGVILAVAGILKHRGNW